MTPKRPTKIKVGKDAPFLEDRYWCGCVREARWKRCERPHHQSLDHDEEPDTRAEDEAGATRLSGRRRVRAERDQLRKDLRLWRAEHATLCAAVVATLSEDRAAKVFDVAEAMGKAGKEAMESESAENRNQLHVEPPTTTT